jgi:Trk K+ transport system NAD-binding subunit
VTVISTHGVALRSQDLQSVQLGERLKLRHVVADYTIPGVLREHAPERYDAVLLVGTDRLESGAESDARSIVGCEVLKGCLPATGQKPRIVIELMDPDNARLFEDQDVDVIVSPQLLGRALAQIALIPELCAVYDDLFGAGGAELSVHDAREYGFDTGAPVRFGELREAATRVGHVLLGVQSLGERRMCMNPPPETMLLDARSVRVVAALQGD